MKTIEHGTTYGYRKGCRCDDCKAVKAQDWQDYRARKGRSDRKGWSEEDSQAPNAMAFEGMDPEHVFLMVDLAWHYVSNGVPIPEATTRARREVLDLP